jgi:hypothetical protein
MVNELPTAPAKANLREARERPGRSENIGKLFLTKKMMFSASFLGNALLTRGATNEKT